MKEYTSTIIEPGVSGGATGVKRSYSEDALKDAADSIDRVAVTNEGEFIGQVTDAWYDDALKCTVEIYDDEVIDKIDQQLVSVAPVMTFNEDRSEKPHETTDIKLQRLFPTTSPSDIVGDMEEK